MTDKIAQAEMFNYLIDEIHKLLLCLKNGGLLTEEETHNIYCILRLRFNNWCDENMSSKEYADYVLGLLEKIKEE